MKELILIFLTGMFFGCGTKNPENSTVSFNPPEIINSQINDTVKTNLFTAKTISEVFPTVVGKYKFQKTIDINPQNRDTTSYKDFLTGNYRFEIMDSLDVNGLELIVDYENTVRYNRYYEFDPSFSAYYPVYFVNSTKTDKVFFGKDSYVFGIQEAIDKDEFGNWKPIETRGFDFCGNGRWGLIVHPQEFVLVLMRKYEGNYKTKLRSRFKIGDNILISRPYIGNINENQFAVKDSSYLQRKLKETDGKAATWLFYGAVPNEELWAGKAK